MSDLRRDIHRARDPSESVLVEPPRSRRARPHAIEAGPGSHRWGYQPFPLHHVVTVDPNPPLGRTLDCTTFESARLHSYQDDEEEILTL